MDIRPKDFWRFLAGTLFGFVAMCALLRVAFVSSLGLSRSITDRNIASWYSVKQGICQTLGNRPKLILVGGSNVLYGIDALEMEQALHFPVVNYGTHAALNVDYLFWRAEKVIGKGDTVLLSLEWEHFARGVYELNKVSGPYFLAADPGYLQFLPRLEYLNLIATTGWDQLSLPYHLSMARNRQEQKTNNQYFRRKLLDPNGDIIKSRPQDQGPVEQKIVEKIVPHEMLVLRSRTSIDDPVWKRLASFVENCRKKGVVVWISAPSMIDSPVYRTPAARAIYRKFEDNFQKIGARILIKQEELLYPRADFFDSFYHLKSAARSERTRLVLDKFRENGISFSTLP